MKKEHKLKFITSFQFFLGEKEIKSELRYNFNYNGVFSKLCGFYQNFGGLPIKNNVIEFALSYFFPKHG